MDQYIILSDEEYKNKATDLGVHGYYIDLVTPFVALVEEYTTGIVGRKVYISNDIAIKIIKNLTKE